VVDGIDLTGRDLVAAAALLVRTTDTISML